MQAVESGNGANNADALPAGAFKAGAVAGSRGRAARYEDIVFRVV